MLAAVLGVPGGLPARQGAVQPAPPLGRAGEGRPGGGGGGGYPEKPRWGQPAGLWAAVGPRSRAGPL